MRWYKHMADMLDDPWVQDVFMKEHGLAGYGFLCGLFEIYAKLWKGDPNDMEVEIPVDTLTRKLRVSSAKVERWLNDGATAGKLRNHRTNSSFIIEIPKMQELRDEWSRKLRSDSGATPEQKKKKEEEVEEEPPTPKGGVSKFEEFWGEYPKHRRKEKQKCLTHWRKNKLDQIADLVIDGVKRYSRSEDWLKESGQYVPYPIRFLRNKRWEDEVQEPKRNPHWPMFVKEEIT